MTQPHRELSAKSVYLTQEEIPGAMLKLARAEAKRYQGLLREQKKKNERQAEKIHQLRRSITLMERKVHDANILRGLLKQAEHCISAMQKITDIEKRGPSDIESIIGQVMAKHRSISWADIVSPRKLADNVVRCRHECMYQLRKQANLSYPEIAKIFHRDHSSVMYAVKKIEAERAGAQAKNNERLL